jgi:hypothetical protein
VCLNQTCSKVWISKYLPDTFALKNGLKQGDAFIAFELPLKYAIRKVQANQE